jgi:hypothetical protein
MSSHKLVRNRSEAFRHQAGRCYYCGVLMWRDDCESFAASFGIKTRTAKLLQCTAEHLHALRDGGTDESGNIVAACWLCNSRRHRRVYDVSLAAYRGHVAKRVKGGKWHDLQVFRSGLIPQ